MPGDLLSSLQALGGTAPAPQSGRTALVPVSDLNGGTKYYYPSAQEIELRRQQRFQEALNALPPEKRAEVAAAQSTMDQGYGGITQSGVLEPVSGFMGDVNATAVGPVSATLGSAAQSAGMARQGLARARYTLQDYMGFNEPGRTFADTPDAQLADEYAAMYPVDPNNPHAQTVASKVGGIVGGLAPIVGASVLPGVGPIISGGTIGGQAYEGTTQEAMSHGYTEQEARGPAAANALVQGGLMSLPLGHAVMGKLGGNAVKSVAGRIGVSGVEGAGLMGTARAAENVIAGQSFDPMRPVSEGVVGAAAEGAAVVGGLRGAGIGIKAGANKFFGRNSGTIDPKLQKELSDTNSESSKPTTTEAGTTVPIESLKQVIDARAAFKQAVEAIDPNRGPDLGFDSPGTANRAIDDVKVASKVSRGIRNMVKGALDAQDQMRAQGEAEIARLTDMRDRARAWLDAPENGGISATDYTGRIQLGDYIRSLDERIKGLTNALNPAPPTEPPGQYGASARENVGLGSPTSAYERNRPALQAPAPDAKYLERQDQSRVGMGGVPDIAPEPAAVSATPTPRTEPAAPTYPPHEPGIGLRDPREALEGTTGRRLPPLSPQSSKLIQGAGLPDGGPIVMNGTPAAIQEAAQWYGAQGYDVKVGGIGGRSLTVSRQTRLDPREVMDQVNYAVESGIGSESGNKSGKRNNFPRDDEGAGGVVLEPTPTPEPFMNLDSALAELTDLTRKLPVLRGTARTDAQSRIAELKQIISDPSIPERTSGEVTAGGASSPTTELPHGEVQGQGRQVSPQTEAPQVQDVRLLAQTPAQTPAAQGDTMSPPAQSESPARTLSKFYNAPPDNSRGANGPQRGIGGLELEAARAESVDALADKLNYEINPADMLTRNQHREAYRAGVLEAIELAKNTEKSAADVEVDYPADDFYDTPVGSVMEALSRRAHESIPEHLRDRFNSEQYGEMLDAHTESLARQLIREHGRGESPPPEPPNTKVPENPLDDPAIAVLQRDGVFDVSPQVRVVDRRVLQDGKNTPEFINRYPYRVEKLTNGKWVEVTKEAALEDVLPIAKEWAKEFEDTVQEPVKPSAVKVAARRENAPEVAQPTAVGPTVIEGVRVSAAGGKVNRKQVRGKEYIFPAAPEFRIVIEGETGSKTKATKTYGAAYELGTGILLDQKRGSETDASFLGRVNALLGKYRDKFDTMLADAQAKNKEVESEPTTPAPTTESAPTETPATSPIESLPAKAAKRKAKAPDAQYLSEDDYYAQPLESRFSTEYTPEEIAAKRAAVTDAEVKYAEADRAASHDKYAEGVVKAKFDAEEVLRTANKDLESATDKYPAYLRAKLREGVNIPDEVLRAHEVRREVDGVLQPYADEQVTDIGTGGRLFTKKGTSDMEIGTGWRTVTKGNKAVWEPTGTKTIPLGEAQSMAEKADHANERVTSFLREKPPTAKPTHLTALGKVKAPKDVAAIITYVHDPKNRNFDTVSVKDGEVLTTDGHTAIRLSTPQTRDMKDGLYTPTKMGLAGATPKNIDAEKVTGAFDHLRNQYLSEKDWANAAKHGTTDTLAFLSAVNRAAAHAGKDAAEHRPVHLYVNADGSFGFMAKTADVGSARINVKDGAKYIGAFNSNKLHNVVEAAVRSGVGDAELRTLSTGALQLRGNAGETKYDGVVMGLKDTEPPPLDGKGGAGTKTLPPSPDAYSAGNTIFTAERRRAAFDEVAKEFSGKLYSNPLDVLMDPKVYRLAYVLAGEFAEHALRAAAGTGKRGFNEFKRWMREQVSEVQLKAGMGRTVSLASLLDSPKGTEYLSKLWNDVRKYVPRDEAVKGRMKAQKSAAVDATKLTHDVHRAAKVMNTMSSKGFGKGFLALDGLTDSTGWNPARELASGSRDFGGKVQLANQIYSRLTGNEISPSIMEGIKGKNAQEALGHLSAKDARIVVNTIRAVDHLARVMDERDANSVISQATDNAAKMAGELKEKWPGTLTETKSGQVPDLASRNAVKRILLDSTLSRAHALTQITGKKDGTRWHRVLDDQLRVAGGYADDVVGRWEQSQRDLQSRHNVSDFTLTDIEKNRVPGMEIGGGKLPMSEGMLYDVYLADRTLTDEGGIAGNSVVPSGFSHDKARNVTVSEAEAAKVRDYIENKSPHRAFFKDTTALFDTIMEEVYPEANKAHLELTGRELGRADLYYHLRRAMKQSNQGLSEVAKKGTVLERSAGSWGNIENLGALKEREGGALPLVITGNPIAGMFNIVRSEADYAHKAVPSRNAMMALQSDPVRTELQNRLGEDYYKRLVEDVRVASGAAAPKFESVMQDYANAAKSVTARMAGSYVSMNPTTPLMNVVGYIQLAHELPNSALPHWAKQMGSLPSFLANYKANVEEVRRANGTLRLRVGTEGHGQLAERSNPFAKGGTGPVRTAIDYVREKGMLGVKMMDNWVTWAALQVAKNQIASTHPTLTGDAKLKAAGELAAKWITRTQNPTDDAYMSRFSMAAKKMPAGDLAFMLTAGQAQERASLLSSMYAGKKQAARSTAIHLASKLASVGMKGLVGVGIGAGLGTLRRKDGEDTADVMKRRLTESLARELGQDVLPGEVGDWLGGFVSAAASGKAPMHPSTADRLLAAGAELKQVMDDPSDKNWAQLTAKLTGLAPDAAAVTGLPATPFRYPASVIGSRIQDRYGRGHGSGLKRSGLKGLGSTGLGGL